ncbi:hypothetical protein ACFQQB_40680 [Nonomuraea rubra]|uniref:hypothetical protein n=1 Tax=Nonomuraea rubra TaxID=46180 RepID=UPI003614FCA4
MSPVTSALVPSGRSGWAPGPSSTYVTPFRALSGADQVRSAPWFLPLAAKFAGRPGATQGRTGIVEADSTSPPSYWAATRNVYSWPQLPPVTLNWYGPPGSARDGVTSAPGGAPLSVYPVTPSLCPDGVKTISM